MSGLKKYCFVFFLCSCGVLRAQVDPHFSQFYAFPMNMNPGMTGAMESDLRFTAIHRSQWGSVMVPFSTQGASIEWRSQANWQFGVCMLNQQAGDAGYHYLNGYTSIAYSGVKWGEHRLSIGLSVGQISRRFDPLKFQFGDQWNPITGYDPNALTGDQLTKTSATSLDAGLGILYWNGNSEKRARAFGGFSWMHLGRPQDPFISSSVSQRMPYRMLVQGGVQWQASDLLSLTPNLLVMKQGSAWERMLAVSAAYSVGEELALLPSLAYRFGDAIVPGFGLNWNNWTLASTYDLSLGEMSRVGPGGKSLEISLRYTPRLAQKAGFLPCPRF